MRNDKSSKPTRKGRLDVDLSNQTAKITPNDGGTVSMWGPGVTRRNAEETIAGDGWRPIEGSEWELMDPPDGFARDVEQDGS